MLKKLMQYRFLLAELFKRDFKKKYKRTVLGVFWSVLSPMLTLFVMRLVFTRFFGGDQPHYPTFLFAGNLMFAYFREASSNSMAALKENADIISKVSIPKYSFVLSVNISALVNYAVTLLVFFLFAAIDGIAFTWKFVLLLYPIAMLTILNIGAGLVLSAMRLFFEDTTYLYNVFLMLLTYVSAIFYPVERFSENVQQLFLLNPLYVYIKYFRLIVIEGTVPSLAFHLLASFYAFAVLLIGIRIYKKNNQRFLYYV